METAVNDLDAFVVDTVRHHAAAATAVRNGDASPLIEMLSKHDPVTLFPASQPSKLGWTQVSEAFNRVASLYSSGTPVEFEVVAAGVSGDLAYLVGVERGSAAVSGGAPEPASLRVTQIYRREDAGWKLVHRHADPGPGGDAGVDHLHAAMRYSCRDVVFPGLNTGYGGGPRRTRSTAGRPNRRDRRWSSEIASQRYTWR
jgi:ketosteroid isomerase-like protein